MDFNTAKALHIIFVVSWFAGLFYIVRLFIYHTEAQEKEAVAKKVLSDQFEIMESKLWWIITTPAMVLAIVFGAWMLYLNSGYYFGGHPSARWMHVKLVFVGVLLVYHFVCQKILFQMKSGVFRWKSGGLRLWNELATLVLVSIAFLVSMKNTLNWVYGTIGFFSVAVALMILIKIYKRLRKT
ncbi:MAG: CopD family protein [Crocinitomicaceae bacterium]|nr:CopD family protein [Crocinitomicaceae bacterium]